MNDLEKKINELDKKIFILNFVKYFFMICTIICAFICFYYCVRLF